MDIDRRSFLRLVAASGLALGLPARAERAADDLHEGPYWAFVHAGGGWDPTLLCDPKGRASEAEEDPVNTYFTDDIEEIGPFHVAPVEGHRAFFQRFRDELLVINGIDTQTNSHETGTRHTWAGRMDPGSPALAALVAAAASPRPTLSLLSNGGYDLTAGLVAPTRLPNTSTLLDLAHPLRVDADAPDELLLHPAGLDALVAAREARLQRQIAAATLPREAAALARLHEARTGGTSLSRLVEVLPSQLSTSTNPLVRQAELAAACFKAGVTVSATLSMSGFDTHGNHDASHTPAMQRLVEGVTALMDQAEAQGIADRLIVVVGSDFARTPWYNDTNGKDHWSITSMMLMGPGIRGGRVIGATDARQVPVLLDPASLRPAADGVRVQPGHIHAALRALAGVDTTAAAQQYGVGEALPLLA